LEENISKIPTGILAAQRAVTSLANTDDPVLKMLKLEPSEGMIKMPPLPSQLIQRKFTEEKPEPEVKETKPEKPDLKMSEAQMLNLANPLGVIMFGGHLDLPFGLKEPEPDPEPEPDVGRVPSPPPPPTVFKVPTLPSMSAPG